MKKLLVLSFLIALVYCQVNAQSTETKPAEPAKAVVNPNAPKAKYDKMVNDFGEIAQGIPKTAEFKLTNEGKEPLIIQSARASCGCTNLQYSQEPILPGKSTTISATYNAAAVGAFTKTITVTTNADANPVVLQIKGTVLAKKEGTN
ncbi:MAG: DUF1573 domain-containing protein [Bacteroidales bacterium]|nr:DUF1573 domain-containing protein [Bacteroidales bacterium]